MSQVKNDVSTEPFNGSALDAIASHSDINLEVPSEFSNPCSKLDQEPNPFEQSFSSVSGAKSSTATTITSNSILPPISNIDTPQAPTNMNSWGAQSLRSGPLSPSMLLGPQGSLISNTRNGFSSYGAQPSPMTAALLGAAAQVSPNFLRNVSETTSLQLSSSSVSEAPSNKKDDPGVIVSESTRPQALMSSYIVSKEAANPENQKPRHINNVDQENQTHPKANYGNREVNSSEAYDDSNETRSNRRRKSTVSTASGEGNDQSEDDNKLRGTTRPNKKSKAENPDEKRKSFLERNRQAALKCRQRKKQWLNNLQAQVEYLSQENETLQNQATSLREEIINLKTLLLAHKNCPIAQANGVIGIEGLMPMIPGPAMAAPTHPGMPQVNNPVNMLGMPQVISGTSPRVNQITVSQQIQGHPTHRAQANVDVERNTAHSIQSMNGGVPTRSRSMKF